MQNRQAMRRLMEEAVAEVTGAQPDHARAVNIHHNFWRAAPPGCSLANLHVEGRWMVTWTDAQDCAAALDSCGKGMQCSVHYRLKAVV